MMKNSINLKKNSELNIYLDYLNKIHMHKGQKQKTKVESLEFFFYLNFRN